jgi:hypothetical protein
MVTTKKSIGKWRMCIDFTYLDIACLKGNIPFAKHWQVDWWRSMLQNSKFHKTILVILIDNHGLHWRAKETAFMTNICNYYCKVMLFWFKKSGGTY